MIQRLTQVFQLIVGTDTRVFRFCGLCHGVFRCEFLRIVLDVNDRLRQLSAHDRNADQTEDDRLRNHKQNDLKQMIQLIRHKQKNIAFTGHPVGILSVLFSNRRKRNTIVISGAVRTVGSLFHELRIGKIHGFSGTALFRRKRILKLLAFQKSVVPRSEHEVARLAVAGSDIGAVNRKYILHAGKHLSGTAFKLRKTAGHYEFVQLRTVITPGHLFTDSCKFRAQHEMRKL